MKYMFGYYFLETFAVFSLSTFDIAKGAPVALMDLLLAIPGVFLLLHMCLVFKHDSAVQRKKVTKFIMLVFVWTIFVNLI